MKTRYFGICGALVLMALVATAIAYPHLPEKVPTHWNIHNQIDAYGSRWSIFLWPGITAGMVLLFAVLPWLSPRHFEIDTFQSTYLFLMLVLVGELTYINALILWATLSGPLNIVPAMMGGVSLLFALMGNVMGKVRRNFYVGVRTPWTLANERVWNATHRFAAKTMVLAGVTGLVISLVTTQVFLCIGIIMLGGLSPIFYSLIYYKRLERAGQLEA